MQVTRKAAPLLGMATLALLGLTAGAHAQYDPTPPDGTTNVFSAADAISSVGSSPNEPYEGVHNAIDGNIGSKYLNFQSQGSGFIDTPAFGAHSGGTVVTSLQVATANDHDERDPLTFTLSGSNDGGATFTEIASGSTGLDDVYDRYSYGSVVSFANTTAYTTYEIVFPTIRAAWYANSMQVSEVALNGIAAPAETPNATPAPEPSSVTAFAFTALGAVGLILKARRRRMSVA